MSTGVTNQRMKGQGTKANGPKDHVAEHEDVESWRNVQMQQGYSAQISSPPASDPYMSNYYNTTFAGYPQYGVTEGNWSNGGDAMGFLGGYAPAGEMAPASYIEGIFGGNAANYATANPNFSSFPAPAATGFNYFPGNSDYSTWGSNAPMARKAQYEDYYRDGMYSAPGAAIKRLEHGMQGMGIDHKADKDLKEPKKMSWATVASQPAKPPPMLLSSGMKKKGPGMPPPPMVPGKHLDIGTWETRNGGVAKPPPPVAAPPPPVWAAPPVMRHPPPPPHPLPTHQPPPMLAMPPPQVHQLQHPPPPPQHQQPPPPPSVDPALAKNPVLDDLLDKNNYNPSEFDMNCRGARFFVIKSYSEDDIHRSIKYEIWCSTEHGNKRLDQAFRENEAGPMYLFFSVNGSGHFCGMAQMVTAVDYHASSSVWAQDKWKGQFRVRWIYVKDVPNGQLRQIRLENNENKPVTNSRDTQEVPFEKGRQVLRVMHSYRHTTSIFDDFFHYEKRQEEEDHKRVPDEREPPPHHNHQNKERNEGREHRERGDREGREPSNRPQRGGRGSGHRH